VRVEKGTITSRVIEMVKLLSIPVEAGRDEEKSKPAKAETSHEPRPETTSYISGNPSIPRQNYEESVDQV